MTCSSNTTSTPERGRGRGRRLALPLLCGAVALAWPLVSGRAEEGAAAGLVKQAVADLERSDGIAAETRLRRALAEGARREDVAALMGEAWLDQGDPARAEEWLAPAAFSPGTAARGFRELSRLRRLQGDVPAARAALDRALAAAPGDAGLWVDLAALRYADGQHYAAIEAADRALEADPRHAGALVFKGMLVRDANGLAAGLPWFEAALEADPRNLDALGEYAATLGDLNRATEMLAATRKMLAIDGKNPRAFFLQAVMAARAGETALARRLLSRMGERMARVPAAILLRGALELDAGNAQAAVEVLSRLADAQPANERARALLARALAQAGNWADLQMRFGREAERPDASPYILALLARAHEVAGRRDLAAPLLDRGAQAFSRPLAPVPQSPVGGLLAKGNRSGALGQAQRLFAAHSGNATSHAALGDALLANGRPAEAAERYAESAKVRLDASLLIRWSVALEAAGRGGEAAGLVERYLSQHPSSLAGARLAAAIARGQGDWPRAVELLAFVRANGAGRDLRVLVDLAEARLRAGENEEAVETAREAYTLHRGSGFAANALGLALEGSDGNAARALLAKARAMGADPAGKPLVANPYFTGR
ncbi:MAG: tetratricopeptide repeat protein [Novosphingobium sp.]|nr:tetratricopeptide repeat protein [Novosphingobium sp.]